MTVDDTPGRGIPRTPEQMPNDYPISGDLSRLKNLELPDDRRSPLVKIAVLAGIFTVLFSFTGLFLAWRDAVGQRDQAVEQLNCPRQSAVSIDTALADAIQAKLRLDIAIADALVAVANSNDAALDAALADMTSLTSLARAVDEGLETAKLEREASLDLCGGRRDSPKGSPSSVKDG